MASMTPGATAEARLPRIARLSGAASRHLLPKFAGLRIGAVNAGGAFPAFMRTRYSWSVVPMTERADDGTRPAGGERREPGPASPEACSPSPAGFRRRRRRPRVVRCVEAARGCSRVVLTTGSISSILEADIRRERNETCAEAGPQHGRGASTWREARRATRDTAAERTQARALGSTSFALLELTKPPTAAPPAWETLGPCREASAPPHGRAPFNARWGLSHLTHRVAKPGARDSCVRATTARQGSDARYCGSCFGRTDTSSLGDSRSRLGGGIVQLLGVGRSRASSGTIATVPASPCPTISVARFLGAWGCAVGQPVG